MNITQLFNNQNILNLFFKAFAWVFSIIYLLFTIVIYKQTQTMYKTLATKWGRLFVFISFLQIVAALITILVVIFI